MYVLPNPQYLRFFVVHLGMSQEMSILPFVRRQF
jgi:hypothetical protein